VNQTRVVLPWRRIGSPEQGFRYENQAGKPITGRHHLARIERLVIPPAWRQVEIASDPTADLQATGLDAAGRRQYLYHPRTVEERQHAKFTRQVRFGSRLPLIRERTNHDIDGAEPTRGTVIATVVRLIDDAYFRVGSERYAQQNKTFGITTLGKRHLRVDGEELTFTYRGKSGMDHRIVLIVPELAEAVDRIVALPGRRLFQYIDEDGEVRPVGAREVNSYIKASLGRRFTAKDFRTWGGTVVAAEVLCELGEPASERQMRRNITEAVKEVAETLGNTPAIARESYINPLVFDRYAEGVTLDDYQTRAERRVRRERLPYDPNELALLALLRRRRTEAQAA
jgi:DNA topoisomerase I